MQAQRLNITLPYELARDLKRAVPAKKRSRFLAKVLKENLKRTNLKAQLIKSLKANKKLYEQVAKDWAPIEVEGWPD